MYVYFRCLHFLWIEENYVDGLVQDCSNSSALALELLQSCTKPSMYSLCNSLCVTYGGFEASAKYTFNSFWPNDAMWHHESW